MPVAGAGRGSSASSSLDLTQAQGSRGILELEASMKIEVNQGTVVVSDGGLVAEARSPLWFGHLGCKRLATVKKDRADARKKARDKGQVEPAEIPAAIFTAWDRACPGWASPKAGAAEGAGDALARGLAVSGASSIELWDTMRSGSDYWRPGALLSQAVAPLGASRASFGRLEELCPPAELLEKLRELKLPWADYAQQYADWLEQDGRIDLAVGVVALAQARSRLAVFYCTDAYIPGYADRAQWASEIPYRKRHWPLASDLREEGCHRVVLADLLVRRIRKLGATAEIVELDPTRGDAWRVSAAEA